MCSLGKKYSQWQKITTDPWVLRTIKGYEIEFDESPIQEKLPNPISFNKNECELVSSEVNEMLKKGAIKEIDNENCKFLSNIFLVPKKNGQLRPVINLKFLNKFVVYEKFKQETIKTVLDLIQENDYFCSIDLKDAYWSLPLSDKSQEYVVFEWNNKYYAFVVLPFGLSSSPRVFTKIMKPVFAFIRFQGVRCTFYLDDSLILHQEKEKCLLHDKLVRDQLSDLGFVVNVEKSSSIPLQRIVYLGLIIDSVKFKIFLPEEKVIKIKQQIQNILSTPLIKIREVASLIGHIVHAFYAVIPAPLHYRSLERDKIYALRENDDNFEAYMSLSGESLSELQWWSLNIDAQNGKPIRSKPVDFWIETDASMEGMGAFSNGVSFNRQWSEDEKSWHINYLELLAIKQSVEHFCYSLVNQHIGVKSDNKTAIAYVNNMGGMVSKDMDDLACQLWQWCLDRNLWISCQYLPGADNQMADMLSREFSSSSCEWSLKTDIFNRITKQFFQPDCDLFASEWNFKVETFVTWSFCPRAIHADAFSLNWHHFQPYIFPPFALISRIVNKIITDRVDKAIMIIPFWKTQAWFPLLLSRVVSLPARLPRHQDLLSLEDGRSHPLIRKMTLIAVCLSGKDCRVEEFRRTLDSYCCRHGDSQLENSMTWHGNSSIFGVVGTRSVPIVSLTRM